jgi:NitT/TauT family transport system ATP-binding protein
MDTGQISLVGTRRALEMIEIHNATFRWNGSAETTPAFCNLSAAVAEGELVAVLGPSGCGKSTLLKCLAGIAELDSGEIRIQGGNQPLLLFQDAHLFPWLNVEKNVRIGCQLSDHNQGSAVEATVERVIASIEMQGSRHKYPKELSGGMRQRVALGRALAAEPRILLMDEPFSALDFLSRQRMGNFLLSIWQEFSLTILFVTHSIEEALQLADRILVMSDAPGTIRDVVEIDRSHPRDVSLPAFAAIRKHLIEMLTNDAISEG